MVGETDILLLEGGETDIEVGESDIKMT